MNVNNQVKHLSKKDKKHVYFIRILDIYFP